MAVLSIFRHLQALSDCSVDIYISAEFVWLFYRHLYICRLCLVVQSISIYLQGSSCCSNDMYTTKYLSVCCYRGCCFSFASILRSYYDVTMLVHSLPMKTRKMLARDITYISATHTRHIHDVTGFVKMAALTAVYSRLSKR